MIRIDNIQHASGIIEIASYYTNSTVHMNFTWKNNVMRYVFSVNKNNIYIPSVIVGLNWEPGYTTINIAGSYWNKTPKVVSVGCVGLWKHNGVLSRLMEQNKTKHPLALSRVEPRVTKFDKVPMF